MNVSLPFDVSSMFRAILTAYFALLIYNFISAVLGLCLLRRLYVGLLRRLYRVGIQPYNIIIITKMHRMVMKCSHVIVVKKL